MTEGRIVLRVTRAGAVIAAGGEAHALLGPVVGRLCWEVVRAAAPDGTRVCAPGCTSRLGHDGHGPRRSEPVHAFGRAARLVCERVGDEVVVVLALPPRPASRALTARERVVLGLVADGLTDRAIAGRLNISPATVRTHVEHARGKLGARTRAQAVARARAEGALAPGDAT